ncbi:MAG: DUF4174 domain-containing protein [Pseudomonadota bacterium]
MRLRVSLDTYHDIRGRWLHWRLVVSAVPLLLVFCAPSLASAETAPSPSLSEFRWQYRILIVATDSDVETAGVKTSEREAALEIDELKERADEVNERNLIWFQLSAQESVSNLPGPLTPPLMDELRRASGGAPGVTLIGKDGGVKYRAASLDLSDVFGIIDSMPMRVREMRHAKGEAR